MNTYKHILVATDLQSDNSKVIEQAVTIAKLSVVNVLPQIPYYMASSSPMISDLEDHLEEESLKYLMVIEAQIEIDADFHLLNGSAKRKITELAQKIPCDSIIIGSLGCHRVDELISSTAIGVLQRSHCDVHVVRIKKTV